MKTVLRTKYSPGAESDRTVPIFWYFAPLLIVVIIISAAGYLNSRDGYLSDAIVGCIEALIVMSPTALAGIKYSVKALRRAFIN
jgi:hypothetical protein